MRRGRESTISRTGAATPFRNFEHVASELYWAGMPHASCDNPQTVRKSVRGEEIEALKKKSCERLKTPSCTFTTSQSLPLGPPKLAPPARPASTQSPARNAAPRGPGSPAAPPRSLRGRTTGYTDGNLLLGHDARDTSSRDRALVRQCTEGRPLSHRDSTPSNRVSRIAKQAAWTRLSVPTAGDRWACLVLPHRRVAN